MLTAVDFRIIADNIIMPSWPSTMDLVTSSEVNKSRT